MNSKISNIVFPTLMGFIVLAVLLKLEDKFHDSFYSTVPNFDSGPQVDIPLAFVLAIPFVLALIFQAFAVLPFWEKMKYKKRLIGLNLWQVVILLSLLIALLLVSIGLYKDGFTIEVLTSSTIMTSMFMLYWITNFLTLTIIERHKQQLT
jgi:hypothetical protein